MMPKRWPTLAQKRRGLTALGIELYPAQQAASSVLAGPRNVQSVVQVIGGERAGKSQWAADEATSLLPACELVYLCGAEYENAEAEFRYVESNARQIGVLADVSKPKQGQWQMRLRFPYGECEIETISANRNGPDALTATGRAPDLVVLCEAGLMDAGVFDAAFSRVAEKRGAVIATGTLKRSRPWYVSMYRKLKAPNPWNGRSFSFPSWQNTAIYPGGRNDPVVLAMEAALGPLRFAERIGAEPVPSPLLVFGQEFDYQLHVRDVEYDAALPLFLACDPGYAGAYALLVVQAASASDVRVIDEYYQQYATWDRAVEWLRNRAYIEKDERGHITNVKRAVMDIAGTQHHADLSQVEQWQSATGIRFQSQPVGIEEGISRMRDFLRSPFAWDVPRLAITPRAEGLLWEMTQGEQYPADSEGNAVKEKPVDAHNHARKAISYLLVDVYGPSDNRVQPVPTPGHDPFAAAVKSGPTIELKRGRFERVAKTKHTQWGFS